MPNKYRDTKVGEGWRDGATCRSSRAERKNAYDPNALHTFSKNSLLKQQIFQTFYSNGKIIIY